MAYSDRELLARLIQCEAGGEGDTGMKAVAGVVMNRVHARGGEYARVGRGSIRNIIFQPYQFVCASETEQGAYNPQNIFNMRPEQIHFDIADSVSYTHLDVYKRQGGYGGHHRGEALYGGGDPSGQRRGGR